MRSDNNQRHLIRECDPALARAYRVAAEVAAVDPHFYGAVREQRVRHYLDQAAFHDTGIRQDQGTAR
ncbi:hypothetical protein Xtri_08135 [Xanthomonas campestris pv. trichodesmae]|uniref:Uncharacterized protein n=2 Tax=Xanthomonas citri TaxID=346 RepID=A0AB33CCU8_XANCI|nr:hypothetical protein XcvCFBP7111P_10355 [Xanthomonas citri pv. vignicola]MBZ3919223.1 hypothetical protein [Xanthomonas campestris pv. trichodesmae]MBZ3922896.1 hypothetical protein [Xanthomonas citri pv. sesbaniae]